VSEQRYHTVFQTSLDAISINRSTTGVLSTANKAFLDTLGMNAMKSLGDLAGLGIWADERDRQAMRSMLQQNSSFRGLEVQFRKKQGAYMGGDVGLADEWTALPASLP